LVIAVNVEVMVMNLPDCAFKTRVHILLPIVPGQVSPLASGIRGCSAAEMPEVPQAWGLTALARSAYFVGWQSSLLRSLPHMQISVVR
jgi:hypothetical protein